jgi:hypothetical protein
MLKYTYGIVRSVRFRPNSVPGFYIYVNNPDLNYFGQLKVVSYQIVKAFFIVHDNLIFKY